MSDDSASATATQTAKERIELEKAAAEARQAAASAAKAEAEAQKAAIDVRQQAYKSLIPEAKTEPLEGKVTTGEGFGYVAELAAYNAMRLAAKAIAGTVEAKAGKRARILIVETPDVAPRDAQKHQVTSQLAMLRDQLREESQPIKDLLAQLPKPVVEHVESEEMPAVRLTAALAAAKGFAPSLGALGSAAALGGPFGALALGAGALGVAADIAGYLQMDFEIKSRQVSMSDQSARMLVAGGMGCPVFLQSQHRLEAAGIVTDLTDGTSERMRLTRDLDQLKAQVVDPLSEDISRLRTQTQAKSAELDKLDETDPRHARLEKELLDLGVQSRQLTGRRAPLDGAVARAEAAIAGWDAFVKAVVTVPEGRALSPLADVALQQHIDRQKITHLLYVCVASSGGESIVRRWLWYWGKTSFLGGCVITFALTDLDGRVVAADTCFETSCATFDLTQTAAPSFDRTV